MIVALVFAAHCQLRYLVVPDPHDFPHGLNLQRDERLLLARDSDVLRADGFPDLDKIKVLCARSS